MRHRLTGIILFIEISKPKKYLTINHTGKDKFLIKFIYLNYFGKKIERIDVNESDYYKYLIESLKICSSPINSHDFPGKLILAKKAKLIGAKAIFGGDGADELFGGYETYRQKISNSKENNSNYSNI